MRGVFSVWFCTICLTVCAIQIPLNQTLGIFVMLEKFYNYKFVQHTQHTHTHTQEKLADKNNKFKHVKHEHT